MTAPIWDSSYMLRKWMGLRGHSLVTRTSLRRSFMVTSAALRRRLSLYPLWIPARVFMLQGTTAIPRVLKLPLASEAPRSWLSYTVPASRFTSSSPYPVSWSMVSSPPLDITR